MTLTDSDIARLVEALEATGEDFSLDDAFTPGLAALWYALEDLQSDRAEIRELEKKLDAIGSAIGRRDNR